MVQFLCQGIEESEFQDGILCRGHGRLEANVASIQHSRKYVNWLVVSTCFKYIQFGIMKPKGSNYCDGGSTRHKGTTTEWRFVYGKHGR
jgi:hypothetical protein